MPNRVLIIKSESLSGTGDAEGLFPNLLLFGLVADN